MTYARETVKGIKMQTWICSISSVANSFCPSTPKNSVRSAPVLPSMSRSVKKSHSCSTPKIRCFNCVKNGYGSQKFMINLISTICLYLKFHYVVSFWLLAKKNSKSWPECMAIATMTGSCPGVEQSSIQGGKLPSSSRSIKSGAMHLAPAPDIKELSNFLLLERSSIQVWGQFRVVCKVAAKTSWSFQACYDPESIKWLGLVRGRQHAHLRLLI